MDAFVNKSGELTWSMMKEGQMLKMANDSVLNKYTEDNHKSLYVLD